jgi:arginine decarboxylase
MDVIEYRNSPILIVDDDLHKKSARGKKLAELEAELKALGFPVLKAATADEAETLIVSDMSISCIALDEKLEPVRLVKAIRKANKKVPIFLISEKLKVKDLPVDAVEELNGYIWIMEDTGDFLAGRMEIAAQEYIDKMLPPFFRELVKYTYEWKYAWHTPGHMGGIAFRKSPSGRFFFNFLGENMFRSDLSVSVPELGSLLDHEGVVAQAEAEAAKVFGAERTYFVTNGTSTANKIVMFGTIARGDLVIVDRNCHKSAMHGIMMTGGIPIYFIPTRNQYGIIGPIHNNEFEPATIKKKIRECKLLKGKKKDATYAIITNSTYDGLCYNVHAIKEYLKNTVDYLHFDEAWYGYASSHPIYAGRYAMHPQPNDSKLPTMFGTQSTHKVMAAFSQGSMVQTKSGKIKLDHDRFNEAFMMHSSTSPQYEIIASLDVASRIMADNGKQIMDDAMEEAIEFRQKMVEIGKKTKGWWFTSWQPPRYKGKPFEKVKPEVLRKNTDAWVLKPNEKWHGFGDLEKDHILLDPIKVTILTPGITEKGGMMSWGIPAGVVTAYLRTRGVVAEKTGHYSFLMLFTMGTTKGKSATLLNTLAEFKKHYEANTPLESIFPDLVEANRGKYSGLGLKDLCGRMHAYFTKEKISTIIREMYSVLPDQAMAPWESYDYTVKGEVKKLGLKQLNGKVSATMIVPYPPGIPVIMPGEKFSPKIQRTLDYLSFSEEFDNEFPGFENEMQGVIIEEEKGRKNYKVYCVV